MNALTTGMLVDAAALALEHEPVPAEQVVAGSPTTASVALDESDAVEIGVWEMSVGAMSDVEADEYYIVLSGSCTVAFTDPALASIELKPGSVGKLSAGMHTIWTVHETLRKIYIAA
ncbi:cupin domain-containing protein (plasmid) [Coraliomargarita sp. W4R53]